MNKLEILNTITLGARGRRVLLVVYLEKDGWNGESKLIEPYSLKNVGTDNEEFFAFDIQKNGIRVFTVNRIESVIITNQIFTPRNNWVIEF